MSPSCIKFGNDGYGYLMTDGKSIPLNYIKAFSLTEVKKKLIDLVKVQNRSL